MMGFQMLFGSGGHSWTGGPCWSDGPVLGIIQDPKVFPNRSMFFDDQRDFDDHEVFYDPKGTLIASIDIDNP